MLQKKFSSITNQCLSCLDKILVTNHAWHGVNYSQIRSQYFIIQIQYWELNILLITEIFAVWYFLIKTKGTVQYWNHFLKTQILISIKYFYKTRIVVEKFIFVIYEIFSIKCQLLSKVAISSKSSIQWIYFQSTVNKYYFEVIWLNICFLKLFLCIS